MFWVVLVCRDADRCVMAHLLVGALHPHGDVDGALYGHRRDPVRRLSWAPISLSRLRSYRSDSWGRLDRVSIYVCASS
jgi:hypothetical protein